MRWGRLHLSLPALLLGLCLVELAQGCGRKPVITKPTEGPIVGNDTSPTEETTHRKNCTDQEIQRAACLQGGTCFALEISNERTVGCSCPFGFTGKRCEYFDPTVFEQEENKDRMAAAGIAVAVMAAVIFVTLIIVIIIWHHKYKKKKREKKEKEHLKSNGAEMKTNLVSDDPSDSPIIHSGDIQDLSYRDFFNENDKMLRTTRV